MTPQVNAAVWALRPDYVAVSIVARGCRNEIGSGPARIVSVDARRGPVSVCWRAAVGAGSRQRVFRDNPRRRLTFRMGFVNDAEQTGFGLGWRE